MSTPSTDTPIHLLDTALDIASLLALDAYPQCGGLAMFAGTVRDHHDQRAVLRLRYTSYRPLAERMIAEIEEETRLRFGVPYCEVRHRLGDLIIGDLAIVCIARAPHRAEAFAACRYAIDAVKHRVPIWKEEFYADGTSAFVEGCCIRSEDDADHLPGDGHLHRHGDHAHS
jgi:molybdopterin synthase catalytic subunit